MRAATLLAVSALLLTGTPARAGEYAPAFDRIRAGLARQDPSVFERNILPRARPVRRPAVVRQRRDSIWNGLLIGAGIGAGGGYLWARNICGSNDKECFAITGPAGVLGGAGIGAAVGGILDALQR